MHNMKLFKAGLKLMNHDFVTELTKFILIIIHLNLVKFLKIQNLFFNIHGY